MKKLIDKLKGAPAGSDQEEGAEDSGFFSTMFQERTDDTQLVTTWRARAQEVGAQPYDRRKGAERFAEVWGADRYVASLGRAELERMSQYLDFVQVPPGQEIIGQD